MLTSVKNGQARRRLRISVKPAADGRDELRVDVTNVSFRPLSIQHVGMSWPYRRVHLWDKLKAWLKHGHHWRTIGWTHQRLPEIDHQLQLPTTIDPRRTLSFDLPLQSLKGAWEGDELLFVLRLRDSRGRNYYGRACRLRRT